jgi:ATP-dependent DNA ligase
MGSKNGQRADQRSSAGLDLDTTPMEARLVSALPTDPGWQYEPKWDGFRCLAFKRRDTVELRAKSGKTLARYFPEVVASLRALPLEQFVIDGELVIPVGESLSFDALQLRLHPAESRVRKLAAETPALLVAFDCLETATGEVLTNEVLEARRTALEQLFAQLPSRGVLRLSPYTRDQREARGWLENSGGALDGVIAKRVDGAYLGGERAMLKVKRMRTADCVVGGFRYATDSKEVGSLLLGLYDEEGKLHHVGFTSGIAADERKALTRRLERLISPPGFTGAAPGGPSRWSTERSTQWEPLKPELVVEVRYDHASDDRFRHGTKLVRWRPDKSPGQCTFEQLQAPARPSELLRELRHSRELSTSEAPAAVRRKGMTSDRNKGTSRRLTRH